MDKLCQALENLSVQSPEIAQPVFNIRKGVEMLININRNTYQENTQLKKENAVLKRRLKLFLEALGSVQENHVPIWVK